MAVVVKMDSMETEETRETESRERETGGGCNKAEPDPLGREGGEEAPAGGSAGIEFTGAHKRDAYR